MYDLIYTHIWYLYKIHKQRFAIIAVLKVINLKNSASSWNKLKENVRRISAFRQKKVKKIKEGDEWSEKEY